MYSDGRDIMTSNTLRDRLTRADRTGLMTADILRAKMTDPRYTVAQKKAMLHHAGNVADDAGDDEIGRAHV